MRKKSLLIAIGTVLLIGLFLPCYKPNEVMAAPDTYDWIGGCPAQTDTTNYDWSGGVPFIRTEAVAITYDITNTPDYWTIGAVQENTSYWSNGSTPTFPLGSDNCTFSVTNDGSVPIDISIKATNFTGGDGWTLTSSLVSLYEYYNTGADSHAYIVEDVMGLAQTFIPSTAHMITKVRLSLACDTTGVFTVCIRATDGEGYPTGGDLCSTLVDHETIIPSDYGEEVFYWYDIEFDNSYPLSSSVKYALVIRNNSSGWVAWQMDSSGSYADGCAYSSSDACVNWEEHDTWDFMFEEWGIGEGEVSLLAFKSGDAVTDNVTLTTSDQPFITNLAADGTMMWELLLQTGVFTDGVSKSDNVTITSTVH